MVESKVTIITGAASGLGLQISKKIFKEWCESCTIRY